MGHECWTTRYTPQRVPPPLELRAPLRRRWVHQPKGSLLGTLRAGQGAIFSTCGSGVSRLDLQAGRALWVNPGAANLILPWDGSLLAGSLELRAIDIDTGTTEWKKDTILGMAGSFTVDNVLVGNTPEGVHTVDLNEFKPLWSKPWLMTHPPASDGSVAIWARDNVSCVDVRSGALRWERREEELGKGATHLGFIWKGLYVVRVGRPRCLTAFDLATGRTVWRSDEGAFFWCQPYGDHVHCFDVHGVYLVLDLVNGKEVFRKSVGRTVPEPIRTPKKGLMVGTRGAEPESWRDVRVAVSETHVFLQNASGQIVVLGRETGEVEQVVELEGMPIARTEPMIYRNCLFVADFNAAVYCFEGTSAAHGAARE